MCEKCKGNNDERTIVRMTRLGLERVVFSPIEKLVDSKGKHDGWGFVFNERFYTRDTKKQCEKILQQLEEE